MNFEFALKINPALERLDFANALQTAETELRKLPVTDFHDVLGKSLLRQADNLATWIEGFYRKSLMKLPVKSLYFEMNEFDINTDEWYIDGFAFSKDGGLNLEDMEWLCDFQADSQTETETIFIIEGYEKLQAAFGTVELRNDNMQTARDWCEQIIIARFMELMRTAHTTAKQRNLKWAELPIYFTEHSYDFIIRSAN